MEKLPFPLIISFPHHFDESKLCSETCQGVLDQKDDFGERLKFHLLWKMSYTYTNENPYCEACTAEGCAKPTKSRSAAFK
jgi:hypothetical protein